MIVMMGELIMTGEWVLSTAGWGVVGTCIFWEHP